MKFGAFQKMHMQAREKYIFNMLLGAFYNTSRMTIFTINFVLMRQPVYDL